MPAARHYDLVVLGAGSGNTVVDESFDELSVAIVERGPMGGTCLNRGCIPSKMYVHVADVLAEASRGPDLDAHSTADGADWAAVRERVLARVDGVADKGRTYREESENVDLYTGTARFTGELRLVVVTEDGEEHELTAGEVVVATGGRPAVPDVPGLHDVPHRTSDSIMRLEELPRRLAVLGGGYIGCEFAHVFHRSGSRVVQIEPQDTLLSGQDADVAERFTTAAAEQWEVRLGASVERAEPHEGGARLHLDDGSALDVDLVLVATGRTPNTDDLGLAAAGVEVDDDGLVTVDEHQRTSARHVWALGDCCTGTPLKHVANHEARVVRHNLLHPTALVATRHEHVPQAVFSHPQVAAVGLTEEQAREQGLDVTVGTAEYADTAYGWALQAGPDDTSAEAAGFVKVVLDEGTGRLVGAHLVGTMASVLVQPLVQAMAFGLPARELARSQYWIHPALSEVVEGALLDLGGQDDQV